MYLGGLKYKTLNFARHLSANYFLRLFLHNPGVLNSNMSVNILYLSYRCHSPSNKQNKKWPPKPHMFYNFCYIILHDFWFLHELINLCLMFFDQNDLCLTFKFKMVTANTHIKAVFMHVSYNVINNRLRNTAYKVARHSKL